MKQIILIVLFISLFSCQNENEIDKEIEVINDIFLQISEYVRFYNFNVPIPPPPPPLYNEKGEFIGIDTVEQKVILRNIENELKVRNIDTSKFIVAVFDTLVDNDHFKLTEDYLLDTIFKNYNFISKSIIENTKSPFKFELNEIKDKGKYELRYYSEFPSGRQVFREKYNFNFGGVITLSRVYFDENYNNAIIFCDYCCGIDCWTGRVLFLQRVESKWRIVNSKLLWIA